jgi:hypothetical protein
MSDKPRYIVSILEKLPDGRNAWRVLLSTSDEGEANALYASLMADEGVKAKVEVIMPRKK